MNKGKMIAEPSPDPGRPLAKYLLKMILNILIRKEMNRLLLCLVITFYICNISYAEKFQYWDELSDNSKSEIIKYLNVDENVMMLYLHKITLSDDNVSVAILDTLCTQTEGEKRMLYFYIMNEIVKCADGALAELLCDYCIKYINENTDYALTYFSKHPDVANGYSILIAAELYYNNKNIIFYKQNVIHHVKDKCAKDYFPVFLKEIEHELNLLTQSEGITG